MAKVPGTYGNRDPGSGSKRPKVEIPEIYRDRAPIDSKSADICFGLLRLPEDLTGLSTLDIGAGASGLRQGLAERGAEAYALDPAYEDSDTLAGRLQRYKAQVLARTDKSSDEIDIELAAFYRDIGNNPDRFVAGSALDLPFEDERFDVVTSIDLISLYLGLDYSKMSKAVNEAIRVTKRQGTIQLFPFREIQVSGFTPELEQMRLINETQLFNSLQSNSNVTAIDFFKGAHPFRPGYTLIIQK